MTKRACAESKTDRENRTTTTFFNKSFVFLGLMCGIAMVFGTPVIVSLFHDGLIQNDREWVESLPQWTVPTILCIGMGGGVLTTLFSILFGLLIPSRVVRHVGGGTGDEKKSPVIGSEPE